MRRRLFLGALASLGGFDQAQASRPVTVVVPFSAGSAQDLFARLISDRLGQALDAPVVVVNKPGAGGTVGAAWVAQAKPDGHTYLLASSSHHLAGALHPKLAYHPLDSFRGAAFFGQSEFVLIASETLKTPDLASFVARVQSQPHVFNYATAGNGSVTHVGMASFLDTAGLSMAHIPLKGTAEIIQEIRAGRVQAGMVSAFSLQAHKTDPKIQPLATTDLQRSDAFASLPALAQSGYPQFRWISWTGLLAPRGTSADKIHHMNRAVDRVIHDPDMRARFQALGVSPQSMSVLRFENLLSEDWGQSSSVISRFRIKLD